MLISDFTKYLVPELQGCPDEMLRVAVVQSARTLCQKAHVWRELQDPIELRDGQREYEPDAPSGARIVLIDEVFCGAVKLHAAPLNELSWRLPDWQTARGTSPAYYTGANDWGVINVYPLPTDPTESLTIRAEYEPIISATQLPDFLLQRYEDEISAGVKYRCMAMPGTPWSSPSLADYWRVKFDELVSNAAIKMIHERNAGTLRVRPRRFA